MIPPAIVVSALLRGSVRNTPARTNATEIATVT